MGKKSKKLFSNLFIFSLGTFGSKLILFFLIPLYTRTLTTDQYGIADLVITIGQLVTPIISLTIYDALFRFGMMPEEKKEDVLNCFSKVFIIGSTIMVVATPLFLFYKSISDYVWLLCAFVITSFSSQSGLLYLKVKNKNITYSLLCIVQAVILIVCNILFLVVFRNGIAGYLLSTIIAYGVTTVLSCFFGQVFKDLSHSHFSKQLLKRMISFSVPMIFVSVSWWVIHSCDKLMIDFMLDEESLGLYTAATKIPALLNVVITIFSQAWTISSIDEYNNENNKSLYSKTFKSFFVALAGAMLIIILLLKPFMTIYVGKDFFISWQYVPLLLFSSFFNGISTFMGTFYSVLVKSKNAMITTVISAVINVALNFVFITMYGVWGAIIGTFGAYFIIAIIRMFDIKRLIQFDCSLIRFAINVCILAACVVLVSLKYNIYVVSGASLLIFVVFNIKELITITREGLSFVKSVLHKKKNNSIEEGE